MVHAHLCHQVGAPSMLGGRVTPVSFQWDKEILLSQEVLSIWVSGSAESLLEAVVLFPRKTKQNNNNTKKYKL